MVDRIYRPENDWGALPPLRPSESPTDRRTIERATMTAVVKKWAERVENMQANFDQAIEERNAARTANVVLAGHLVEARTALAHTERALWRSCAEAPDVVQHYMDVTQEAPQ